MVGFRRENGSYNHSLKINKSRANANRFITSFRELRWGVDLLLKTVPAKLKSPVFLPSHREAHRHEKTRYTEEKIAFALKQAETGTRAGKSAGRWAFLKPLL